MMYVFLGLFACGGVEAAPGAAGMDGDAHAGHAHASPTSHADHMTKMAAMRDDLRVKLGAAYDAPVDGLASADKSVGKSVYEGHCMACHGGTGHGDGPGGTGLPTTPSDFSDAFHARYYSDAGRVWIIQNGHGEQGMPAYAGTLTPEQIVSVYAYVRTFRGD